MYTSLLPIMAFTGKMVTFKDFISTETDEKRSPEEIKKALKENAEIARTFAEGGEENE